MRDQGNKTSPNQIPDKEKNRPLTNTADGGGEKPGSNPPPGRILYPDDIYEYAKEAQDRLLQELRSLSSKPGGSVSALRACFKLED